jgi:predicted dehydrogenase
MLRLAISGVQEAIRQLIAPRLRGATIQADDCDAAVFLGPVGPEASAVERLLTAGKHILVAGESYLGDRLPETLDATAERGGVHLRVVNPDRYLPSRQLIRQQIDRGLLGEVGLVRLHRWEPAALPGASRPAGTLPAPLVRDLDLAVWLIGKRPDLVYAVVPLASAGSSAALIQVHLGFPGGGMTLIDYSDHLPAGDGYGSLSVIGSRGAAYADDHHNRQLLFGGGAAQAVRTGEGGHLAALVQEFVDVLRSGVSPSIADWRGILAVTDAVSQSLASRQAVRLEDR